VKLEGHELHGALYVHVKNPEIKAGIFEPAFGLGLGLFYFRDYEDSLPLGGGGEADVSFKNGWVAHGTISLKLDFNVSDHFKFGFNLKNHILFYASEQFERTSGLNFLGNMETETTSLDNLYYAFEPSFYISLAF
jgi:hypothetical protein